MTYVRPVKSLKIIITKDNYKRAIQANSGGCIIADAIKEQYPHLNDVKVDTAHIRVTDRKAGERYMFLTAPSAVDVLIRFDQGLEETELPKKLRIRDLLRISPIAISRSKIESRATQRARRLVELKEKEQKNELTRDEKRSLKIIENRKEPPQRPTSYGPITAEPKEGDNVSRGRPIRVAGKHPNLLAGKHRHFGAKQAIPSKVVQDFVKAAIEADRAERRHQES